MQNRLQTAAATNKQTIVWLKQLFATLFRLSGRLFAVAICPLSGYKQTAAALEEKALR